jgi:hypothetical protein
MEQSVRLLAQALVGGEYRWVRYGAARSLAEATSRPRRQEVIDVLLRFDAGYGGGAAQPMIPQEIVEARFIKGAARGWGNAAMPLPQRVLERATSEPGPGGSGAKEEASWPHVAGGPLDETYVANWSGSYKGKRLPSAPELAAWHCIGSMADEKENQHGEDTRKTSIPAGTAPGVVRLLDPGGLP